jgi:hypothetical protein
MVGALMKQSADVVITPSATYMYSTIHKPYAEMLNALGVAYPGGAVPVIVAYPVHEPDSLFLHLIIAHELGHSAIAEHDLDQQVYKRDPDPAATAALLTPAVGEYISVEGGTPTAARGRLRVTLRNWLTEIICDSLALAFLGPSFLFTAAAFSTPFGGPEPSDTHPPFTLRMSLLIDRVDAWGWRETIEKEAPQTFKWIESSASRPQQAGPRAYFLRLEEAIKQLAPTINGIVEDHLGDQHFKPEAHEPVAGELRSLLEHTILPAQLIDRTAASRRSITLAGWLHAFTVHGDEPVKLAAVVGDRDQQRFLTKALEMSAILERWEAI